MLDCKQETCIPLGAEAPMSVDFLCYECQRHWDLLKKYLSAASIPFRVDHRLVRGLDYYTRTVFEIQPKEEGGQSTICGGGRYDGLIEQLGGKPTPGVGFGTGMERLALNLKRQEIEVPDETAPQYLVASIGESTREAALNITTKIRKRGAGAVLGSASRSLRGQMRQANALGFKYVVIVGEEELARNEVGLRNMSGAGQETVSIDGLLSSLDAAS